MSERILLTTGGKKLPILKSVTCVKYNDKNHLLETFFDLSDRKKIEQELKLAHAALDQIFQTASVGMRVVDRDFNILKINRTFETMTDVKAEDVVGKKCHEVFSGPKCFTAGCPLTLIMNGENAVNCYVKKQRTDGRGIPCILTATPFKDSNNEIIGIVESFQDITDLKKAQEAILSERDKLNRIMSHMTTGIGIVNSNRIIEYNNKSLKEFIGDCRGKNCFNAFWKNVTPCEPCLMQKALKTGQIQQHEFETDDGRFFEQVYTPLMDVDEKEKVVVL